MRPTHEKRKIIWAIDPFEEPLKSKIQLVAVLREISKKQKVVVEPVHVLNLELEEEGIDRRKYAAIRAASEEIKDIQNIPFLPPHIIMLEDWSFGEMANSLVDYATKTHARLIVTGTHARHGLSRLLLGSFTETLLLYSHLPVITIGPECSGRPKHGKILFATDFGEKSYKTFQKVLAFAQESDQKITFFYSVYHGIEPVIQSSTYLMGGGWISTPEQMSDQEYQKQKLAEEWVKEAKEKGVIAGFFFESERGNTANLILRHAKVKHYSWIAMAAESGAIRSAVIGSIVRQVVRQASCPVWVARIADNQGVNSVQDKASPTAEIKSGGYYIPLLTF